MKTIITTITACLLYVGSMAQTKNETIHKQNIGYITAKYGKHIDLAQGDTMKYIILVFQDMRYSAITSNESVLFTDIVKDSLKNGSREHNQKLWQFLADMKQAMAESESKPTMSWDRDDYKLSLLGGREIYLYGGDYKQGFTWLTPNAAKGLMDWFKLVGFSLD